MFSRTNTLKLTEMLDQVKAQSSINFTFICHDPYSYSMNCLQEGIDVPQDEFFRLI